MKIKANLEYKPSNFQMDDCQIEKVVELSAGEFAALRTQPLQNRSFIAENKDFMFSDNGVLHCLLALGEGSHDGVLIESEGYDYPRYAAYVPGMRDIVNAELERAAEFVVRQGIENTRTGSWCVYTEEVESLGLTLREGSGFDVMLKAALEGRPEVAAASMEGNYIETAYRPEFCPQLQDSRTEETVGIRVKDILPLLKGSGLIFLCHDEADTSVLAENLCALTDAGRQDHALLLNAHVAEICSTPEGTEVVLTDVAPEELARFNESYDAFMEAEQATGPVM